MYKNQVKLYIDYFWLAAGHKLTSSQARKSRWREKTLCHTLHRSIWPVFFIRARSFYLGKKIQIEIVNCILVQRSKVIYGLRFNECEHNYFPITTKRCTIGNDSWQNQKHYKSLAAAYFCWIKNLKSKKNEVLDVFFGRERGFRFSFQILPRNLYSLTNQRINWKLHPGENWTKVFDPTFLWLTVSAVRVRVVYPRFLFLNFSIWYLLFSSFYSIILWLTFFKGQNLNIFDVPSIL